MLLFQKQVFAGSILSSLVKWHQRRSILRFIATRLDFQQFLVQKELLIVIVFIIWVPCVRGTILRLQCWLKMWYSIFQPEKLNYARMETYFLMIESKSMLEIILF